MKFKYSITVTIKYWMGEPLKVRMHGDSLDDIYRECQTRWGRLSGFTFELEPDESL